MKIYIGGSMHFAKEMLETQKKLEEMGFEVLVPADTEQCVENPELNMDPDHTESMDIMRDSMMKLEDSDIFLVLNHPKNGMKGYIGGATLIEIGLAYYLKKKTFLLYTPPEKQVLRYTQEILHTKPIILNGDIQKIK